LLPIPSKDGACCAITWCSSTTQANCCPTVNITQVCYNDGRYCSGNGRCVDGTCVCSAGADGTADWTGPACNITVRKRKTCGSLNVTDCQSCLDAGDANGLYCGWCTTGTPGTAGALSNGRCSEDNNCVASGTSNVTNLAACQITTIYKPEPCPDNCTGHGSCQNKTVTTTNPDGTANTTNTSFCACTGGYTGLNCGNPPVPVIAVAVGLAAGAIVGIIVGVVACLAIAGGGAFAAAKQMDTGSVAPVSNNPIYQGNANAGTNPLYKS